MSFAPSMFGDWYKLLDLDTEHSMHAKKTRLAVIGYGRFGRVHALRARAHPLFEVTCVVDPLPQAMRAAQSDGFQTTDSLDRLPQDIDAACVVTPSPTHANVATALMRKGISVLVEKPFATSEFDITSLLETARATGCHLFTAHIERFNPALALSPWQDVPENIEFERCSRSISNIESLVLDLMVHDLDLVSHLLGADSAQAFEVIEVRHSQREVTALLAIGPVKFRVRARNGDDTSSASIRWSERGEVKRLLLSGQSSTDGTDALTRQYTAFHHALQGQHTILASAMDGAMAARRAIAIAKKV